jgi:uncharacterized protein
MEAAPLPAANSTRRPRAGGAGKCARRQLSGCAAATALWNNDCSKMRADPVTRRTQQLESAWRDDYLYRTHVSQKPSFILGSKGEVQMALDEKTRTELEAAAFRRLIEHLRKRTDVQNLDLMNLAGFCRNCLSNWMKDAADTRAVAMSKDESRELIYGMPYEEWKTKYQKEAANDQQAKFEQAAHKH